MELGLFQVCKAGIIQTLGSWLTLVLIVSLAIRVHERGTILARVVVLPPAPEVPAVPLPEVPVPGVPLPEVPVPEVPVPEVPALPVPARS